MELTWSRLPTDLTHVLIRQWIFPSVVHSLHHHTHRSRFQMVLEELDSCFPSTRLDEYSVTEQGTCLLMFPRKYYYQRVSMYLHVPPQDAKYLHPDDYFTVGFVNDVPDARITTTLELHWNHCAQIFRVATFTLLWMPQWNPPQFLALPSGILRMKVH